MERRPLKENREKEKGKMPKLCIIDLPLLFPGKRAKKSGTNPGNVVLATEPWNAFRQYCTKIQIHGEESERGRKSMLANDSLGRYQSLETASKPDTRE